MLDYKRKSEVDMTASLHQELEVVKVTNVNLRQKLTILEKFVCNLDAQSERLNSKLSKETKRNGSLVKERESLSVKLHREHTLRLEMSEYLQKVKNTHQQKLEALYQELEILKAAGHGLFNINKDVKYKIKPHIEGPSAKVATETKKDKTKFKQETSPVLSKKSEITQLQMECTLNLENQVTQQQASSERDAICWELEALNATVLELYTKLQTETKTNKSLTKQKEALIAKRQKEHTLREELRKCLKKEKDAHQQQLEALHQELENLKAANHKLSNRLNIEEEATHTLKAQNKQLSVDIATESEKNKSLSKEKESLTKELLEERTKLEKERKAHDGLSKMCKSQTTKLEKEQTFRLELIEAVQKATVAHQQMVEALHQEREALKEANLKISTTLKNETEHSRQLQTLNAWLSTRLETEMKKINSLSQQEESLIARHQGEHTLRLNLSESLQKEKEIHQQETEALHQELEALKAANHELSNRLSIEKEATCNLTTQNKNLNANMVTEAEKNELLLKEKESLTSELQKERSWRLELINQLQRHKVAYQQKTEDSKRTNAVTGALRQELKALKAVHRKLSKRLNIERAATYNIEVQNKKLSANVAAETKKNESLSKEKEALTKELQKEHRWRLELVKQLEKHKMDHQDKVEAVQQICTVQEALFQELEALKAANLELSVKFQTEAELRSELQAQNTSLSSNLETATNKNKSALSLLSREKESLAKELQEWRMRLETEKETNNALSTKLQEETALRLDLQTQLAKQKAHRWEAEDVKHNNSTIRCVYCCVTEDIVNSWKTSVK